MEKNEHTVIEKLLPHLQDYLMVNDVKIGGDKKFKCINPQHDDNDPSCSVGGQFNETIFHCFGCGAAGNIFTAAHYLEGLPIRGLEFFTQTLVSLAKRYGIDYEPSELNEDQKALILLKSAYADASHIVTSFAIEGWNKKDVPSHVAIIKERGITEKSVSEFKIGAIPSTEEYKNRMLMKGWDESYLIQNQLLESPDKQNKIFVPGKIILTICDHFGNPIAFVARKADWKSGDKEAKYVNTSTTAIYQKALTLFGFDLARGSLKKKSLTVVEGYIDVVTLRQEGFRNVAGLGSAALNIEVLDRLDEESNRSKSQPEIKDIVLSFDGDAGGLECTRRAVEDLSKRSGVTVRIKQLPEGTDPDEIIQKHGRKFYEGIEEYSTFKWLLKYRDRMGRSEEDFVKDVCSTIAQEDSPITRRARAGDLADIVQGFSIDEIVDQIDLVIGNQDSKMNAQMEHAIDDMNRKKASKRGVDLVNLVHETHAKLKRLERDYRKRLTDPHQDYITEIGKVQDEFAKNTGKINGFKLNSFPRIQGALDGFPDKECLITVAGDANIGKSSWMREISWDIAKSNDDAAVVYMSIDDSTRDVLQALVARESQQSRRWVDKYGSLADSELTPGVETKKQAIDRAWKTVTEQARKNYIIFDSTHGGTIMHLQDHISFLRKHFPKKRPIVFLDNFHKLRSQEVAQIREKFVDFSQILKDTTQLEDIPIVMTVELRKTDGFAWPNLQDIAETKQIEYDSKVVFTAYQRMHYFPDSLVRWKYDKNIDPSFESPNMPYLEMRLAKNKQTSNKSKFGYRFQTDQSILREVDYSEINDAYKRDKAA